MKKGSLLVFALVFLAILSSNVYASDTPISQGASYSFSGSTTAPYTDDGIKMTDGVGLYSGPSPIAGANTTGFNCGTAFSSMTVTIDLAGNYTINKTGIVSNWAAYWSHNYTISQNNTGSWVQVGSVVSCGSSAARCNSTHTPFTATALRFVVQKQCTGGSEDWHALQETAVWGVSSAPILTLSLVDVVDNFQISGFCTNVSNSTNSSSKCGTGTQVQYNSSDLGEGTYNITFFNVTSGNSSPVYLNVTNYNKVFSGVTNIVGNTTQGYALVNVTQLYTNNTIFSFNITNNKITNSTSVGGLYLPVKNGSNNVKVNVLGNYSLNYSVTGVSLSTVLYNATGIYDNKFTIGANFQGSGLGTFTTNAKNTTLSLSNTTNTTTGNIVFNLLQGYSYTFTFNSSTYATQNTTLTANASTNLHNFSVLLTNTLNLSFYDEITQQQINETVTLQLISDSFAQNYTINRTQTKAYNLSLLSPSEFTLRYSSPTYTQRDYYITLTNGTYNNIDLYMINTSIASDVLATVETIGSDRVENATIKLLRYYVSCNCYKIVQMGKTSGEGQALFWVQALSGFYKWSVDYQGANKFLSETGQQIVSDTVFFTITTTDDFYESFEALTGMSNILTYNMTSGVMTYTFSDPSGITTQGCLNVRYVNGTKWDERESCVSGSAGSVILTLDNSTVYRYNAIIDTSTTYTQRIVLSGYTNPLSSFDFGLNGSFLSAGILLGLTIIFSFSAIAVVVVNALALLLISWLGFMPLQTTFIISFAAMAIGLGVFLLRK